MIKPCTPPTLATPKTHGAATGESDSLDHWYPVQVKHRDKIARSDIDGIVTAQDDT